MNGQSLILSSFFFINACAMNSSFTPEHSLNVEYMQSANAINDAQTAISNNNFTLIGFDQRGLVIPGVKGDQVKSVQKNCLVQGINGMGDVVKSDQHLKQMKKVSAYSKTYNLEILKATSCH